MGSPAGMCAVDDPAFYRYVIRVAESGMPVSEAERLQLDVLDAIPHADDEGMEGVGDGWRVVPAASWEDWPVLEATPARLRAAFQTARRVLWKHAGGAGIRASDVVAVDAEIDAVLGVLHQAEAGGYSVSVSYVS